MEKKNEGTLEKANCKRIVIVSFPDEYGKVMM